MNQKYITALEFVQKKYKTNDPDYIKKCSRIWEVKMEKTA